MYEMDNDVPVMRCHLDTVMTMFPVIKDTTGPGLTLAFTWCGREPDVRGQTFPPDNDNKCSLPYTMPFIKELIP